MSESQIRSVRYVEDQKTESELADKGKIGSEKLVITPNDSNDPSFTNLQVPYRVICRERYHKAGTRQRLQFMKEIRMQEISQSKALSGVRIHRVFINPVLAPPEPSEIIKLTPKQQFKLEQLLNE